MSFHSDLLDINKCTALKSKSNPHGLTLVDLKALCKAQGLSTSGSKGELCQRLIANHRKQVPVPVPPPSPTKKVVVKPATPVKPKPATPPVPKPYDPTAPQPMRIGRGGWGCVYKPAIACDGSEPIVGDYTKLDKPNTVSKLSPIEVGNEEFDIFQNLNIDAFDPDESFHIGKPLKCKPVKNQVDILDKRGQGCSATDSKSGVVQLIFANGGTDLESYVRSIRGSKEGIKSLFKQLTNVVRGVALMHKHKIYHNDIKKENIVIDRNGTCRLVDFGLSYGPGVSDQLLKKYGNVYMYWPPDANMFLGWDYFQPKQDLPSTGKARQFDIYQVKAYYEDYHVNQQLTYFLHEVFPETRDKFESIVDKLYDLYKTHKPEEIFQESLRKIDVYSLAVLIFKLGQDSNDTHIANSAWNFVGTTRALHYNPFRRYDMDQFYEAYLKFVEAL